MRSPLAADLPQRTPFSTHSHRQPARRQTTKRQALCCSVSSSASARFGGGFTVKPVDLGTRGASVLILPITKVSRLLSLPCQQTAQVWEETPEGRREEGAPNKTKPRSMPGLDPLRCTLRGQRGGCKGGCLGGYALATCQCSNATGVARPKICTATLIRVDASRSLIGRSIASSTIPGKEANGPLVMTTSSPTAKT